MKKDFEVLNIKCGGCATTVKKKLIDRFPDVTVDLDHDPRIVSATINNQEEEDYLIKSLCELGYPLKTPEIKKSWKTNFKPIVDVLCPMLQLIS